ncbi:MAG: LPXTG cell wall anchor domain-containing protein, partial [Clostridiaceae bacterium]
NAVTGTPINNTAAAVGYYGEQEVSGTAAAVLNIIPIPASSLKITKSVNRTEAYPGQKVTYTMVVTNTGNVALTDVLVSDPMLTGFDGTIGNLAVNESKTLTADYTIPTSAAIGSPLNNTATVTGYYGEQEVSGTAAAVLTIVPVPAPSINITKTVNSTKAYPGQKVTYTMVVKNTGNVALTDVLVTDLMLTGFDGTIGNLAVNESKTLTADYTIPASTAIGSPLNNTATVTGNYGDNPVSDNSSASLNITEVPAPGLSIAKTANVLSAKIGDTIKYTITVTNTGNMDLQNVSVSDLMLGLNKNITLLTKGSSESFTENYVVPENTPAGNLTNTAAAVYGDITVSSKVNVNILEKIDDDNPPYGGGVPGIKVIKTVDKTTAKIGDTVKYTITVINTGTVDLKNVLITDKMLGINDTIDLIKEGDNKKIIKEYVIPQNTALGNLVNIAEASVTYNDEEITASGSAVTKIIEAVVNIDDDDVPEGGTTLPKTGGIPFSDFIVLGLGVTLLGLIFIKKK